MKDCILYAFALAFTFCLVNCRDDVKTNFETFNTISPSGGTLVIKPKGKLDVMIFNVINCIYDGKTKDTPAEQIDGKPYDSWKTDWCKVEYDKTKIVVTADPNTTGFKRGLEVSVVEYGSGFGRLFVSQKSK